MNDEILIRQLRRILNEDGSPSELLGAVKQLIPPEQVIVTKEESPRKEYWAERTRINKQMRAIADKEEADRQRIEHLKQKKDGYCFKCKKYTLILNPEVTFRKKANEIKKTIIIKSVCGECKQERNNYGGLW